MGNVLCRNCRQRVPQGRLTYCSDECVHQWKMTTSPTYVREQVFLRDNGVCSQCGWRAEGAHQIYVDLWRKYVLATVAHKNFPEFNDLVSWHDILTARGIKLPSLELPLLDAINWKTNWGHGQQRILSFWEVDHSVRVVHGNGVTLTTDGLVSLCKQCHLKKTLREREEHGR